MLFTFLLPLALLPKLLLAVPHPSSISARAPQAQGQGVSTGQAIYFLTNDGANAVVSVRINPDGSLGDSIVTQTGGAGDIAVDAEGQPAVPDALVSQSALTLVGRVRILSFGILSYRTYR